MNQPTRRDTVRRLAAFGAATRFQTAPCPTTRLKALMGNYPHTRPIKAGVVTSPCVSLDFADVAVPNTAFKRVVRSLEFDIAELAIATFLIARGVGAPLVLLPAVMFSRFQLPYLVYNAARGKVTPANLAGKRIAVRSYTTTTAMWIRGMLAGDYGVNLDQLRWVVFEEGHVREFSDPPNVERAPAGASPAGMLLDGTVDAAIVDPVPDDPRVLPVVPLAGAAETWQKRHQAIQVNHMVVVKTSVLRDQPEAVREVWGMLRAGQRAARGVRGTDDHSLPFGRSANRRNLEIAIDYAHAQRLIPRRFTVNELLPATADWLD